MGSDGLVHRKCVPVNGEVYVVGMQRYAESCTEYWHECGCSTSTILCTHILVRSVLYGYTSSTRQPTYSAVKRQLMTTEIICMIRILHPPEPEQTLNGSDAESRTMVDGISECFVTDIIPSSCVTVLVIPYFD